MKTLRNLKRNSIRILAIAAVVLGMNLIPENANAQSRSFTRDVLEKTSYVLDEAVQISDYFYYDNGDELLSKASYFQDFAYDLYDARRYNEAVNYSLMARSYAINSMESCDDYWEYYDYNYYGYSDVWGRNSSFGISIGNNGVQLHFGLVNAPYHNNHRVNWDLYFTTNEWNYYHRLPTEVILLDGFYRHRGRVVFNDWRRNPNVYTRMRTRFDSGRRSFAKSYPHMVQRMAPRPQNMRPHNAKAPSGPSHRRDFVNPQHKPDMTRPNNYRPNTNNRPNDNHNNRPNTNVNQNRPNTNVNQNRPTNNNNNQNRPNTNVNQNRPTNNNNNQNRPSTNVNQNRPTNNNNNQNRPSTNVNQNRPQQNSGNQNHKVDNNTNRSQDRQARREIKESSRRVSSSSTSSSSRSSSTSSSRTSSSRGTTTSNSRRGR